jgi:hypothetical protein
MPLLLRADLSSLSKSLSPLRVRESLAQALDERLERHLAVEREDFTSSQMDER